MVLGVINAGGKRRHLCKPDQRKKVLKGMKETKQRRGDHPGLNSSSQNMPVRPHRRASA